MRREPGVREEERGRGAPASAAGRDRAAAELRRAGTRSPTHGRPGWYSTAEPGTRASGGMGCTCHAGLAHRSRYVSDEGAHSAPPSLSALPCAWCQHASPGWHTGGASSSCRLLPPSDAVSEPRGPRSASSTLAIPRVGESGGGGGAPASTRAGAGDAAARGGARDGCAQYVAEDAEAARPAARHGCWVGVVGAARVSRCSSARRRSPRGR